MGVTPHSLETHVLGQEASVNDVMQTQNAECPSLSACVKLGLQDFCDKTPVVANTCNVANIDVETTCDVTAKKVEVEEVSMQTFKT